MKRINFTRMTIVLMCNIIAFVLPAYAGTQFEYTFEGQTLTYEVLSYAANTCEVSVQSKDISGVVTIPDIVQDGDTKYFVTEIGSRAFEGCPNITEVTLSEGITSIGYGAFSDCTNLVQINLPRGLKTIGAYVFSGSDSLKKLIIPSSVESISQGALTSDSLEEVIVEDGGYGIKLYIPIGGSNVKKFYVGRPCSSGYWGFYSVEELTIAYKNIDSKTGFKSYPKLKNIYVTLETPPNVSSNRIFDDEVYENATLHVNKESLQKYKQDRSWGLFKHIAGDLNEIPTEAITVSPEVLTLNYGEIEQLSATVSPVESTDDIIWSSDNPTIAKVSTDGLVEAVGVGTAIITATSGAVSATCTVTVLPRTETIDGLEVEIIPGGEDGEDALKIIGGTTDGNGTLTIDPEIEIDGKVYPVIEVAPGAFKDRNDIKKVIIPFSIVEIGDEAFSGCVNLVEVIAEDGENLLGFGKDVFKNVPIEILYNGRNTSGLPFGNNDKLTSLTFGDKVTVISSSDFAGCTSIKNITVIAIIPPTVSEDSFEECVYNTAILRVPDDAVEDYKANDVWSKFFILIGKSDILPDEIELDVTEIKLIEGTHATIQASVMPENSTVVSLNWSSNNDEIATVDVNGTVTAVSAGTSKITATTINGITASCTVKVIAKTGISDGLNYEIITDEGDDPYIVIKGGKPDENGKLTIQSEIEIDGVKYPVKEIAVDAFKNRTDIKEVVIPASIEAIGDAAFSGCINLKKVVEEDGDNPIKFGNDVFKNAPIELLYIGRNHQGLPYAGNDSLTKVEIGDKVTTIGSEEYAGCKNILDVVVTNSVPPVLADDAFEEVVFKNATLRVPDGSKDSYKAADGWNKFGFVIEASEIPVVNIELDLSVLELTEGSSQQLVALLTPENATDRKIIWTSSNEAVAIVDPMGIVSAIKPGEAVVTANCGRVSVSCEVIVTELPEEPGEDDNSSVVNVNTDAHSGVTVIGNDIIVPEGSKVFDINGRIIKPINLGKGVYIVRTPTGKSFKVRL